MCHWNSVRNRALVDFAYSVPFPLDTWIRLIFLLELSWLWLIGIPVHSCFHFFPKMNTFVRDLFLASHCFWKGTCTFGCSACASVICYFLLKLPSCTLVCGIVWTFARNGKGYALICPLCGVPLCGIFWYALICPLCGVPLCGILLRACDALPAPFDFT